MTTRNGAPLHGVTGEGKTAISAASSQLPSGPCARASTPEERKAKNAHAISDDAVVAAAARRAGINLVPSLKGPVMTKQCREGFG
jgi:hypothetical protein